MVFYGLSLEVLIELMTHKAYKPQHLVYQLNLDNGAIEWGNTDCSYPKADLITLSDLRQIMESIHPDDREKLVDIGTRASSDHSSNNNLLFER